MLCCQQFGVTGRKQAPTFSLQSPLDEVGAAGSVSGLNLLVDERHRFLGKAHRYLPTHLQMVPNRDAIRYRLYSEAVSSQTLDHPFFARMWTMMSDHETPLLKKLRAENLEGLTGRVLEVGAGTGTNFEFYPDTVTEVVALEPETRLAPLAREAATSAAVPVSVIESTIEAMPTSEPFDAVVCSLVLCSVEHPDSVLWQLNSVLKPGGELRYFEHVASSGWRGGLQKLADVTLWPRIAGNCHTHRDTEATITAAGFTVSAARRQWTFPAWVPLPVSEVAVGRAVKA